MNPTFTSKGGFKIVINGVAIYKVANVDINIETNKRRKKEQLKCFVYSYIAGGDG